MARVLDSLGGSFSHRRLAFAIAQLFVVGLIAVSSVGDVAAEKPYPIGQTSQQFFVTNCRGNGGVTKRVESRVVECTLPNDYKIVCNWNSGLCKDFPPKQQRLARPLGVTVSAVPAASLRNSASWLIPDLLAATRFQTF